jgi:hypothetical protein
MDRKIIKTKPTPHFTFLFASIAAPLSVVTA